MRYTASRTTEPSGWRTSPTRAIPGVPPRVSRRAEYRHCDRRRHGPRAVDLFCQNGIDVVLGVHGRLWRPAQAFARRDARRRCQRLHPRPVQRRLRIALAPERTSTMASVADPTLRRLRCLRGACPAAAITFDGDFPASTPTLHAGRHLRGRVTGSRDRRVCVRRPHSDEKEGQQHDRLTRAVPGPRRADEPHFARAPFFIFIGPGPGRSIRSRMRSAGARIEPGPTSSSSSPVRRECADHGPSSRHRAILAAGVPALSASWRRPWARRCEAFRQGTLHQMSEGVGMNSSSPAARAGPARPW